MRSNREIRSLICTSILRAKNACGRVAFLLELQVKKIKKLKIMQPNKYKCNPPFFDFNTPALSRIYSCTMLSLYQIVFHSILEQTTFNGNTILF